VRSTAELYDWELLHLHHRVDQDVRFYRQLALATGGPTLELACGTGRVLSRLPGEVVGLDIDHQNLLAARRLGGAGRAGSAVAGLPVAGLPVVQGDMRRFAFGARFGLVAIPYNSLQLLSWPDAVACLRCAAGHLAPGGLIAFEATDFAAAGDVAEEVLASEDGVTLVGSLTVDGDWLHYHRRFTEGASVHEDTVSLRRAGASTAEALVAAAGLRVVSADWVGLGLRVVAASSIPA
jgi:SAM-dependent methyltransferase